MSGNLLGSGPAVYLDDGTLEALGLDPWTDCGWVGEHLAEFARRLRARRDEARVAAERALLERHRRSHLEPWMAALVERELESDVVHCAVMRVLPLVERTELDPSGRLSFVCD